MIFKGATEAKLLGHTIVIQTRTRFLFNGTIRSASDVVELKACLRKIEEFPIRTCPDGFFIVTDVVSNSPPVGRVVLNKIHPLCTPYKARFSDGKMRMKNYEICIADELKVSTRRSAHDLVKVFKTDIHWI